MGIIDTSLLIPKTEGGPHQVSTMIPVASWRHLWTLSLLLSPVSTFIYWSARAPYQLPNSKSMCPYECPDTSIDTTFKTWTKWQLTLSSDSAVSADMLIRWYKKHSFNLVMPTVLISILGLRALELILYFRSHPLLIQIILSDIRFQFQIWNQPIFKRGKYQRNYTPTMDQENNNAKQARNATFNSFLIILDSLLSLQSFLIILYFCSPSDCYVASSHCPSWALHCSWTATSSRPPKKMLGLPTAHLRN